jgi:hypothetical protein
LNFREHYVRSLQLERDKRKEQALIAEGLLFW